MLAHIRLLLGNVFMKKNDEVIEKKEVEAGTEKEKTSEERIEEKD